jgi:hypothetical protein
MPIGGPNGPGAKSDPSQAWMPGVEQCAERHAALYQRLAVERELVGVVVRVGGEHRRHRVERLHAPDDVVVDQGAVRNLGRASPSSTLHKPGSQSWNCELLTPTARHPENMFADR